MQYKSRILSDLVQSKRIQRHFFIKKEVIKGDFPSHNWRRFLKQWGRYVGAKISVTLRYLGTKISETPRQVSWYQRLDPPLSGYCPFWLEPVKLQRKKFVSWPLPHFEHCLPLCNSLFCLSLGILAFLLFMEKVSSLLYSLPSLSHQIKFLNPLC